MRWLSVCRGPGLRGAWPSRTGPERLGSDASRFGRGYPDRVFAARIRAPVEPAVAGLDLEAGPLEQPAPLAGREPGEGHRRLPVLVAHAERQRSRRLVPHRVLEDSRLALEPAVVRLGDVGRVRGGHVA